MNNKTVFMQGGYSATMVIAASMKSAVDDVLAKVTSDPKEYESLRTSYVNAGAPYGETQADFERFLLDSTLLTQLVEFANHYQDRISAKHNKEKAEQAA